MASLFGLITESYSWTNTAETKNDENMLVILDKDLAGVFEKKFEERFGE